MKVKHFCIRLLILTLGLFVVTTAFARKNDKRPKLVFEKTAIDVGTVKTNETKSFDFVFKNKGDGKLVILEASSSCTCTQIEYDKGYISKAQKGKIHVTYDAKGVQPCTITKTISIMSNSPEVIQKLEFKVKIIN